MLLFTRPAHLRAQIPARRGHTIDHHPAASPAAPLISRPITVLALRRARILLLSSPIPPPRLRTLLHTHVQPLPSQGLQQRARSPHAGEILRRVHVEHVRDAAGDSAVHGTLLHVQRVDAQQLEVKAVAAGRAAAEVREDEEGASDLVLVLGRVGAGDEGAHEAARGLHVGADGGGLGFVVLVRRVEQRAVQGQHALVVLLRGAGGFVGDFELEDGWWVDDSAVALAETAGSGCGGLLSYCEGVVEGWCLRYASEWHWRRCCRSGGDFALGIVTAWC